mgnify:CR=1 FL=1
MQDRDRAPADARSLDTHLLPASEICRPKGELIACAASLLRELAPRETATSLVACARGFVISSYFDAIDDARSQKKNMTETASLLSESMQDLLKIEEAAEFLRVTRVSMYRLVEKRAIPFYRVLHRILFKKKDLLEFVERGKTNDIRSLTYEGSEDTG